MPERTTGYLILVLAAVSPQVDSCGLLELSSSKRSEVIAKGVCVCGLDRKITNGRRGGREGGRKMLNKVGKGKTTGNQAILGNQSSKHAKPRPTKDEADWG